MSETKKQKQPKEPLPRTVSEKLFKAWNRLKRKGDPEAMAAKYGFSRVPFDNALNYGYVAKDVIATSINAFFKERLDNEDQSADELNELADAIENSK